MNKRLLYLLALATGYFLTQQFSTSSTSSEFSTQFERDAHVGEASDDGQSNEPPLINNRQAQGAGTVVRILPDDDEGSRHQRFILELPSGRTLLVAHNIDLAPRIAGLHIGDTVEFNGEFESNPQGGVIHWTHRDPNGRHVHGWLRHAGNLYQ